MQSISYSGFVVIAKS